MESLCSAKALYDAWQYARRDARNDFVFDVIDYADVEFNLDAVTTRVAREIAGGVYKPAPLAAVEVPKSPFTVRPGAVISVVDLIVVYAILRRLAPALDNSLSPSVFSYRLPRRRPPGPLFAADESDAGAVHGFYADDAPAPWFEGWVEFCEATKAAAPRYGFCATGDVTSFFEHVPTRGLCDRLGVVLGPEYDTAVNFLAHIFDLWGWSPRSADRAEALLPQGNDCSLFLANFYLTDLDQAMAKLVGPDPGRYLRYVDDFRVFTPTAEEAYLALRAADQALRPARLSLQPGKTQVLASAELFDVEVESWLDRLGADGDRAAVAKEFLGTTFTLARAERWERVYQRALSILGDGDDDGAFDLSLAAFLTDPSCKLLVKNFQYLKRFAPRRPLAQALGRRLADPSFLFPYHKMYLYRLAAYARDDDPILRVTAMADAVAADNPWYTRMAALFCLNSWPLSADELEAVDAVAESETHPLVVRAALVVLRQRPWRVEAAAREHQLFAVAPGQRFLRDYVTRVTEDAECGRHLVAALRDADPADADFITLLHRFDFLRTNAAACDDLAAVVEDKLARCSDAWPRLRGRLIHIRDLLASEATATADDPEREYFAAVLRASGEAVVTADLEGHVKVWNDRAAVLFGVAAEEATRGDLATLGLLPPECHTNGELVVLLQDVGGWLTVEDTRLDPLTARVIWVACTYSLLGNARGGPAGITLIGREVSDRHRGEKAEALQRAGGALIAQISSRLVAPADLGAALETSLAETATLFGVDRAYAVRFAGVAPAPSTPKSWFAAGATGARAAGVLRLADSPWWHNNLADRQVLVVEAAAALARNERALLAARGVTALVAMPLFVRGEFAGFVACEQTLGIRRWEQEEINLLVSITALFAETIGREEGETQLRSERDRARIYLDAARVIMVGLDLEGRVTLINPYGCALLGYEEKDLLGRNWFEICLPPHERRRVVAMFEEYIQGDIDLPETYEYFVLTAGGEHRAIVWRNAVVRDAVGRVVGTFSSGEDVTARVQAEAAVARTKRRQLSFVKLLHGIYYLADLDAVPYYYYGAVTAISGYASEDLQAGAPGWLDLVHPDDRAALGVLSPAVRTVPEYAVSREYRILRRDGAIRWVRELVQNITGDDGQPVLLQGIVFDVTPEKQAEEARRQTELALRTSESEKAAILAGLNTPALMTDLNSRILWINDAARGRVFPGDADIVGQPCHDALWKSAKPCGDCPARDAVAADAPREKERRLPDGTRWLVTYLPVRAAEGRNVGVVHTYHPQPPPAPPGCECPRKADYGKVLSEMAAAVMAAPDEAGVIKSFAGAVQRVTQATAVVVDGHEKGRGLVFQYIAGPADVTAQAQGLEGTALGPPLFPAGVNAFQLMSSERAVGARGLYRAAFGVIPKPLARALMDRGGVSRVHLIAARNRGDLLAVAAAVLPAGAPKAAREKITALASFAAEGILRRRARASSATRGEAIGVPGDTLRAAASIPPAGGPLRAVAQKLQPLTRVLAAVRGRTRDIKTASA